MVELQKVIMGVGKINAEYEGVTMRLELRCRLSRFFTGYISMYVHVPLHSYIPSSVVWHPVLSTANTTLKSSHSPISLHAEHRSACTSSHNLNATR